MLLRPILQNQFVSFSIFDSWIHKFKWNLALVLVEALFQYYRLALTNRLLIAIILWKGIRTIFILCIWKHHVTVTSIVLLHSKIIVCNRAAYGNISSTIGNKSRNSIAISSPSVLMKHYYEFEYHRHMLIRINE